MQPTILSSLGHVPAGMIGDEVHIAYQWVDDNLCRIYLGTRQSGPFLQYDAPDDFADIPAYEVMGKSLPHPSLNYDGNAHVKMPDGAWTPIYSRGDFGKRYAFGGHWSGHYRGLHPHIMASYRPTRGKSAPILLTDDNRIMILPGGVDTGLTMHEIDCSVGWTIWFPTAREAMQARLTVAQIREAKLPPKSVNHLILTETQDLLDCINDVIEAYNL